MKYVNIDLVVFQEPEFSAATPKQVGIWLRLYAFCAAAENHGIILTAGSWNDAHCLRAVGCKRKDLDNSPLWHINTAGRLVIEHYNLVAEEFSIKRRRTQLIAASARSDAKTAAAQRNGLKGGRPKTIIFPLHVSSNSTNPP